MQGWLAGRQERRLPADMFLETLQAGLLRLLGSGILGVVVIDLLLGFDGQAVGDSATGNKGVGAVVPYPSL